MAAATMTTQAAAERLGISTDTVLRLFKAGALAGYRTSDRPRAHVRLYVESVEAYQKRRDGQASPG